jgi:cytochrome c peroxidase
VTLEQQALMPIVSADEMHQNLQQLVVELQAVPGYRMRFRQTFGDDVTSHGIAQALAAFQRTLRTKPSRVDRYLAGERNVLTESEKRGLELFRGAAGCIRCHHGPLLTDGRLHRLGVSFRDTGRGAVTGKKRDNYRFRTPSLRNVAQTAPYMHDGSLKTLEDVVFFYLRGVPGSSPDGQPLDIQARSDLSFSATAELVDFLKALTGPSPQVDVPTLP